MKPMRKYRGIYSKKDKNITETEITYLNRNIWASISWREARFIKTEPLVVS